MGSPGHILTMDPSALREAARRIRIAVVGDSTIDRYTIGSATRLSPEGPVPAVTVTRELFRPGASYNAVENLANLGIGVEYLTVVGGDPEGRHLVEELGRRGIPAGGVVVERGRRTTSVHRVLSDGHLLLWMERSSPRDISRRTESELLERLRASADGLGAIVVSDHARGIVTRGLMRGIVEEARRRGIPVFVNGRGANLPRYAGADLVRLSRAEASAATGIAPINDTSHRNMCMKAASLAGSGGVLVTWLEEGAWLLRGGSFSQIPPPSSGIRPSNLVGIGDAITALLAFLSSAGLDAEAASRGALMGAALAASEGRRSLESLDRLIAALSGPGGAPARAQA